MMVDNWNEYKDFIFFLKKKTKIMCKLEKLNDVVHYIFNDSGKKLRPLILLLSCEIVCSNYKQALYASLAIEAIHTVSLIHDDILDDGILRRNKLPIHKKYNNEIAILCSDLLISNSIVYISKYDKKIVNIFGKIGILLCYGEAIDAENKYNNMTFKKYIDCIKSKTASLFEMSALIGCLIGKGNKEEQNALKSFGKYFGISYQLIDDLLEEVNYINDKKSMIPSNSLYSIYIKSMKKEKAIKKTINFITKSLTKSKKTLNDFDEKNEAKIKLFNLVDELEKIKNDIEIQIKKI